MLCHNNRKIGSTIVLLSAWLLLIFLFPTSCASKNNSSEFAMSGGPRSGNREMPGGGPPGGGLGERNSGGMPANRNEQRGNPPPMETMVDNTLPSQNSSRYFTDLDESTALVNAYVDYLYEKGILVGYKNLYYPNNTLTRGDLAAMLYEKYKYSPSGPGYSDISIDTYYYQATAAGKANYIFEDTALFYPNEPVTREQAAIWIYMSERQRGMPTEMVTKDVSHLRDKEDITKPALEAVATMIKLGILKPDNNGKFNPQGIFTRAEFAPIMYRLLLLKNGSGVGGPMGGPGPNG